MSVKPMVRKLSGYEAAQSGAAFFLHPGPGYVRVSGVDRLDFLQRQTTNDITSLHPGSVLQSILTSPIARVLDVLYALVDNKDCIGLVTLPGYGEKTTNYLNKRIFFMDKVNVVDSSHEFAQVDIEGPMAGQYLRQIGIDYPSELNVVVESELNKYKVRVFSKVGFSGTGYRVLTRVKDTNPLFDALEASGLVRMNEEDYDILRVECGFPAPGHELIEEYTPLEVNLLSAISITKGCYTGQEVIARQVNYDKITKRLVGVWFEETVQPKAIVYAQGKPVGEVTSIVHSPRLGEIGLAVVRRPYYEADTEIEINDGSKNIYGRICELPFVDL